MHRARLRPPALVPILALLVSCATDQPSPEPAPDDPLAAAALDSLAEPYVRLVLGVGEHDADYVDAYYGPPEWREEVRAAAPTLAALEAEARALVEGAAAVRVAPAADSLLHLRRDYLETQLRAVLARIKMLGGKRLTFEEESRALYDAVAPHHDTAHFEALLAELDSLLPGQGEVAARLERYRAGFVIPPERLDTVFRVAIDEARRRTLRHVALPPGETFVLEYVTDKSWSGYNWYQGGGRSLIQINTDLPIYIERAIDLGAHEGYPGHHVYNALLEQHLVNARGMPEFSVYPLFSPQSLIAEGSANFGIEVAFPGQERVAFARDVLFPLAMLDPAGAERYFQVLDRVDALSYAGNEAARAYLDGEITGEEAADYLNRYALMSPERARQRVRFIDQYRSYVINYNYGQDLVREWVERQGGTADDPERRWEVFTELLASPRLPSGLR